MLFQCEYCGREFSAKPSQKQRFCSLECFKLSRPPSTATCEICGREFQRTPAHQKRNRLGLFCSHKCHGQAIRGEGHHFYRPENLKACECCGAPMRVNGKRRATARACSRECYGALVLRRRVAWSCQQCSAVQMLPRSIAKRKRFCSRKCSSVAHRDRVLGEKNPRWVHGRSQQRYSAEFRLASAEVRERDAHACQLCGLVAEQYDKAWDVHHINYDKGDNRPENLICLCRWCHGRMHGSPRSRNYWRRKLSSLSRESLQANTFTMSK